MNKVQLDKRNRKVPTSPSRGVNGEDDFICDYSSVQKLQRIAQCLFLGQRYGLL